jgi:deoxycytidine triphosphate deaminase
MTIDFSNFATDDSDAAVRAARYANEDPLRSVPCALLSSAEIHDYARITGMLFPFFPEALKPASYEAHIGGEFIRWDEQGHRHKCQVRRGDPCKLLANSITFVQVEPKFRLPNYIAVRFNLRITHVHRGLLLGTGPLVDPGFEGKLLIPLHNLTASEYDLDTNAALIWIEFTKTTFSCLPKEEIASKNRHFIPFPSDKKNLTPDYYLLKANGGDPIRSSIPDALARGREDAANSALSAKSAEEKVTSLRNLLAGLGFGALATLAVALFAIYLQVSSMVQNSTALTTSVEQGLAPLVADRKMTAEGLSAAQNEIAQLREQLNQLSGELDKLKSSSGPPQLKTQAVPTANP